MFQRGPRFLHLKDVFREAEYTQSFLLRCLYHLRGGTRNYVAVEICNDRHEIYAPQRSGVYGSNLPLRKRSMLNCPMSRVLLAPSRMSSVSSFAAVGECMKPRPEKPQAQRNPSISVLPST